MRTTWMLGAALALLVVGGCKGGSGVNLELDMKPQAVTVEDSVRLSGQARGVEPSLSLNGKPVPVHEGFFEVNQPLQPGDNVLTLDLSARPKEGAAPEQKTERFEVKRVDQATFDAQYFYSGISSMGSFKRVSSGGLLADKAEVKLTAKELTGVRFEEFGHENRPVKGGMPMEITLKVGQGRAKVSVKPEQGPSASAVATPDKPATLNAKAELRIKTYSVRIEALDGPARDVELVVRY
ncbi:MAG: hypothetical protein ACJ8AT_17505 [Hyalangium sp.]|uniref:hypothetical protein n=1 Tax=Hyalangium sp. TaxID=2028555 RepID=UPI00389A2864